MAVQELTENRMSITQARPGLRPAAGPKPLPSPPGVHLRCALASGGLLWLCYFPLALGWLAWVALVPFLFLVRSQARPRVIYWSALAGGLVFYVPALQWMRVADPRMYVTWIVLAFYCALYFPVSLLLLRFLDRRTRLPLTLILPIVWTALEFFRSTFCSGFSWYLLAHSQHDWLRIIQVSDVTGAYGVSFLVVAVNAIIFELCWMTVRCRRWLGRESDPPRWSRTAIVLQSGVVLLAVAGTWLYGEMRMGQTAFTPGPRVALLQGNLPQQIRNDESSEQEMVRHFFGLASLADVYAPELIVWPETSLPGKFADVAPGAPVPATGEFKQHLAFSREIVKWAHDHWPTNIVIGMNSQIMESEGVEQPYNSAMLIDDKGRLAGRYDKMHRVPFGEFVPLRDTLPFMNRLAPYDFEYGVAAGQRFTQFPLKFDHEKRSATFGVVICYEDTVPEVASHYGGSGSHSTDFLLNISNDGWFDGTSEHEQHLAISRFRAVECRRAVGRAVNMGVSALIDSNGRVLRPTKLPHPENLALLNVSSTAGSLAALPWWGLYLSTAPSPPIWGIPADPAEQTELPVAEWQQFKKVPGVLLATIPIDHRSSFYAQYGDWLPWSCWGLLGVGLVLGAMRRWVADRVG